MKNNEAIQKRFARAIKRNPMRSKCPACGTNDLLTVFPDQFCTECDWDSVFAYVESGKLNDLNQAYFEHFVMPKIVQADIEAKEDKKGGNV